MPRPFLFHPPLLKAGITFERPRRSALFLSQVAPAFLFLHSGQEDFRFIAAHTPARAVSFLMTTRLVRCPPPRSPTGMPLLDPISLPHAPPGSSESEIFASLHPGSWCKCEFLRTRFSPHTRSPQKCSFLPLETRYSYFPLPLPLFSVSFEMFLCFFSIVISSLLSKRGFPNHLIFLSPSFPPVHKSLFFTLFKKEYAVSPSVFYFALQSLSPPFCPLFFASLFCLSLLSAPESGSRLLVFAVLTAYFPSPLFPEVNSPLLEGYLPPLLRLAFTFCISPMLPFYHKENELLSSSPATRRHSLLS